MRVKSSHGVRGEKLGHAPGHDDAEIHVLPDLIRSERVQFGPQVDAIS